jgi:hypothetical protein
MTDLPEIPSNLSPALTDELQKARYQKQLDIAETVQIARQDTAASVESTRIAAALAVENARADTELSVENARVDTAEAVENARIDKAREVMEARVDADRAAEVALLQSVHDGYIEVCKASLDRSLTRATFLVTAITGVSTVYTTLLGVAYAVGTKQKLPARAMLPVVFLGVALVCAAIYVAFLHGQARERELLPSSVGGDIPEERLKTFMEWSFAGVLDRAWAIRTAIVAFAIGIMLLPLPFVAVSGFASLVLAGVGVALIILWVTLGEGKWGQSAPGVPDPPALAGPEAPSP